MKKTLKMTGTVLTVCLFIFAILILRSGSWMLDTWTTLQVEELIFHLQAPIQGTNQDLISSFITSCLLVSALMGLLLIITLILLRKKKIIYRTIHGVALVASVLIIFTTVYGVWSSLKLDDYVDAQSSYSTFIDSNYVSPSDVQLKFPNKKRNLIHIYLESMETTYSDVKNGGAFEENLVPEITRLAQTYEDFSGSEKKINGAVSLSGSTWTMGALFAQTSGLPLSLPIDGNAMWTQESFLPNLTNLGDILENAGYTQAFLIGSDGTFGGRELYFQEHGSYQIWDYSYFVNNGKIPSGYYVWWGFEDKYLIEFAKEKLSALSSNSEPFNLTMLTVDTHYEDGYVCEDCRLDIENNQYANVMRCSSSKIAKLITWIQAQDFYENTTIVLTGDHPTMDSDFCSNVPGDYQRKMFTIYINAPLTAETDSYRQYCTYDIFPTTLASLGVDIEGDRLGLGTNLFSDTKTLCEEYGVSYVNEELKKKSALMKELTSDITYAKGTVSATIYEAGDDSFDILVDKMDYSVNIIDIRCLVWTQENREDAKWYILPYAEGSDYRFTIPVSDFADETEQYEAEVFAYADNAMMYSLGTTTINMQ